MAPSDRRAELTEQSPQWEITGNTLRVRGADGAIVTASADQIFRAAIEGELVTGLPDSSVDTSGTRLHFSRYPLALEVRITTDVEIPPPHASVCVIAQGDGLSIAVEDVVERQADHVISDGKWHPLERGALQGIADVLREAGISAPGAISLKAYLTLLGLSSKHPEIHDQTSCPSSRDYRQDPKPTVVPSLFTGVLYDYQLDGFNWLAQLVEQGLGCILADEMGLGKTVQLAALLAGDVEAGNAPSLVVAPATLLENWRRELVKFAPSLSVVVHRGRDRVGAPSELEHKHVVVTSYDTLIRDVPLLARVPWSLVVLDEAQAVRNPSTRRAKAAQRLHRRAGIAVTGTPVENGIRDLWSLTDFALPGYLGTLGEFESLFPETEAGASLLERLVSPILLRRRIEDVARDLPDRIDIPQALELGQAEAEQYEQIRISTLEAYQGAGGLVALTRLRMYCTHPALLGNGGSPPESVSPKYQRLIEVLDEIRAAGEKALIFTSFTAMADLMVADLSQRFNVPAFLIDGRTAVGERQPTVDLFSSTNGPAFLILNPRAAGVGLNITAANHVIHYTLEWNPAVEDQASARAHRRGQSLPVTVHRLFYVNTVEDVIDRRMAEKRSIAGTAVVGTDGTAELQDIAAALSVSPLLHIS